jgi:hypothetical protein
MGKSRAYIELREDQLEVAPAKRQVSPKSTPKKPVKAVDQKV